MSPKRTKAYTTTSGERVTKFDDGTETRVVAPVAPVVPQAKIQPSVTATDLATPPPTPQPPVPTTPTVPDRTKQFVSNVARDTQGFITAQSEEAAKARDLAETYGALGDQGSLADLMKSQRQDLGIDTNLSELKDIQLQLTDLDTSSALTKTQIEGAAGQTIGQAQREVTQEDRENAVRTSGLAARAAVLQGNINTATQLAKDTVDLAFKDRQLEAENLLNQINYYQGIVDDQTGQLLEEDKRQYEAELGRIEELKTNIANAMVNGASQAEIAQLNDPNVDDATKLSMAQQITARGMNQLRNLDIQAKQANISQSYASIAASNTNRLLALAEAGDTSAIDQLGFNPLDVPVEIDPTTKRQLSDGVSAQESLLKLAGRYKEIVDTKGFTNTLAGDPTTIGEVKSLRALMTAEYKKAAALGTLDTGVLTLMDSILGNEPTSTWNPLTNITGRKSEQLSSQLDTFINQTESNKAKDMLRLGINPTQVDFSLLSEEDENEINAAYGGTAQSTPSNFNAANYFK